jgi:CheY-like chemotaxis protein
MSGSDEASGEEGIAGSASGPASERSGVPGNTGQGEPLKVLVYSHDADTRDVIRLAIGRRPAPDVPRADIIECATEPALFQRLDRGSVDIMILDGEAQPAGGMGVCRQAKDEIYDCPPALLIIGRADDGWLATWSRADAVVSQPIDPAALAGALAGLMRHLLSHRGALAAAANGSSAPPDAGLARQHDAPAQA